MDIKPVELNDLVVFKEYLEEKLDEVRGNLVSIDEVQPLFIYSDGEEIKEISLTMKEENWDEERKQMEEICRSPKVKYAALLFDSYIFTGDIEKVREVQRRGTDLQDVGGTVDVILLFLYTRNKTYSRRIDYEKRDIEDYWFADRNYQDVTDPGKYSNPFPA